MAMPIAPRSAMWRRRSGAAWALTAVLGLGHLPSCAGQDQQCQEQQCGGGSTRMHTSSTAAEPRFATCPDGGAAAEDGSCEGAEASDFKVLVSLDAADFDTVRVVRTRPFRHDIDFLLAGTSCIGARYVDDEFADQSVFKIFNILQTSRFLDPRPKRGLALGLGAGDFPSAFRAGGVKTDVVELHPGVVKAAAQFFDYAESGPLGSTFVTNARDFVFGPAETYDVILHDLFSGSNPMALLSTQLFERLRDAWLAPKGVLLVNFLGYHAPSPEGATGQEAEDAQSAYPFSLAVVRTLRGLFSHVRCFTDHEPNCPRPKKSRGAPGCSQGEPSNIVCWCSSEAWRLRLPGGDPMYVNPPENSAFWTIKHFQKWEVLRPDTLGNLKVDPLEETASVESQDWAAANAIVASHMRRIVRENLLPHDRLWRALEQR